MILFNDLLVVCDFKKVATLIVLMFNYQSDSGFFKKTANPILYQYVTSIPLEQASLTDLQDTAGFFTCFLRSVHAPVILNGFQIVYRRHIVVYCTQTPEEKLQWLHDIESSIQKHKEQQKAIEG